MRGAIGIIIITMLTIIITIRIRIMMITIIITIKKIIIMIIIKITITTIIVIIIGDFLEEFRKSTQEC